MPGDPSTHAKLGARLQNYLADYGQIANLAAMADGHAGLTFGFELHRHDGASAAYILKKAPEGVPRSGSTDIYRQAPLLRALNKARFPAPNVPWAYCADDLLGAPFIVMERLPGRSLIVWDPEPAALAQFEDASSMWTETARLMGALHRFDWSAALSKWQVPTTLAHELERWARLLRHMPDGALRADAEAVARALAASRPDDGAVGLIHGDLQPGNVLFADGRAHGLIDWDLAAIGPIGLDVGWLAMIGDADGWSPDWRPHAPPARAALLQAYEAAGGAAPADLDWQQAFAFFRMAAITGLNLKLHRDGRRSDPIWERFATATPFMLARATHLLSSCTDSRTP